jgi:hypothetical protein
MRGIFHVQVLFTFIAFFFYLVFFFLSFGLEGKKDFYAVISHFFPLSPGTTSRSLRGVTYMYFWIYTCVQGVFYGILYFGINIAPKIELF